MSETLKPCPFCGNASVYHIPGRSFITCNNDACSADGPMSSPETAYAAWNRRTPGPATRAMLSVAKHMRDHRGISDSDADKILDFIAEWEDE